MHFVWVIVSWSQTHSYSILDAAEYIFSNFKGSELGCVSPLIMIVLIWVLLTRDTSIADVHDFRKWVQQELLEQFKKYGDVSVCAGSEDVWYLSRNSVDALMF